MRRYDKKIHMEKVNKAFQKRVNESKFNWNGKYANEDDPELEEGTLSLGDDMEVVDEEVTNITTDINNKTQFFSDVDADRRTDNLER